MAASHQRSSRLDTQKGGHQGQTSQQNKRMKCQKWALFFPVQEVCCAPRTPIGPVFHNMETATDGNYQPGILSYQNTHEAQNGIRKVLIKAVDKSAAQRLEQRLKLASSACSQVDADTACTTPCEATSNSDHSARGKVIQSKPR